MTACTFLEISPPARLLSPNNLLATLERAEALMTPTNPAWMGGIQFVPQPCGGGGIWPNECVGETCTHKVANGLVESVKWTPNLIYSAVTCGSFSDKNELMAAARSTFNISEPVIAASELYYAAANKDQLALAPLCDNGDAYPPNPYLATPDQFFPTGTDPAVWTTAQVLLLDQGWRVLLNTIASEFSGTQATIHVSPGLLAILVSVDVVTEVNGLYRTTVGNHLVIGAPGYFGASPADETEGVGYDWPDVEWIYVTGPMGLLLGSVDEDNTFEHRRNNYVSLVERFSLPFFDPTCSQFALPVSLDAAGTETDFTDTEPATLVERRNNDHLYECTGKGEEMSPGVFVGVAGFGPF